MNKIKDDSAYDSLFASKSSLFGKKDMSEVHVDAPDKLASNPSDSGDLKAWNVSWNVGWSKSF